MGGGCTLDYNVSSGPFLSYEIEIGDGPGPELDNNLVPFKLLFSLKVVINDILIGEKFVVYF